MKKILFCGTGTFATQCLKAIHHHLKATITPTIVTSLPKRTGRGLKKLAVNQVLEFAVSQNLDVLDAPATPRFKLQHWLEQRTIEKAWLSQFDLGVVVDFGYFLPADLIRSTGSGFVNVHPSLLPSYRGASPIQHALMKGEQETGVSVVKLDPDTTTFDTGDILLQKPFPVPPDMRYSELSQELALKGAEMLVETLKKKLYDPKVIGETHSVVRQRDTGVEPSHAPKIKKTDAVINWAELTNEQVYNKFRALSQTVGVYTTFNQLRVTLCNIQLATADLVEQLHEDKHSLLLQPGMIGYRGVLKTREVFLVACKKGFISCSSVKPESKKQMSAISFIHGYVKQQTGTYNGRQDTPCFN